VPINQAIDWQGEQIIIKTLRENKEEAISLKNDIHDPA
jgi:hypothetical protein